MKGLKKLYCTDERGWGTGVCSLKTEEFEIVELLSKDYDIQELCTLMGVSRSEYYKWKKRDKSKFVRKRRKQAYSEDVSTFEKIRCLKKCGSVC